MTPLASAKTKATGLTHRQIAEVVGVSPQLVGFALRGQGRMSQELRQRILDVARDSGYDQFSNGAARSMAARRHGKKPKTGVLAVPFASESKGESKGRPLSTIPFFTPFFEGIESEAFESGLDLLLCPLRSSTLPRLVREGQVDGVVCLVTDKLAFQSLGNIDIPVVHIALTIGRPEVGDTPTLSVDDQNGGASATRHLIELGHRRIAYIGFSHLPSAKVPFQSLRLDGYCNALKEAGLPLDESLIECGIDNPAIQDGTEAMQALLERTNTGTTLPFTALVCHNDPLAMGAIYALQEAGFHVPEDVSVVGFDDVSAQYAFRPSLTSVSFDREQMGRRAVRLLSEMESEDAPSPRKHHESFAVELIERESTRPYSGESL